MASELIPAEVIVIADEDEKDIEHDDLCPICLALLYEPVRTICNHVTCKYCLATWADTSPRQAEAPERQPPQDYSPQDVEVNCPVCRTPTAGTADPERAALLEQLYPQTYAERRKETDLSIDPDIQYMTLYVGNKHRLKRLADDEDNRHEWTFYVRTSRDQIIRNVFIHLHPTLDPSHIMRDRPPFELRMVGWGSFCIQATVILREGWVFAGPGVNTYEDKKFLRLHWTLDMNDRGSQYRYHLKFRAEKPEDGAEFMADIQAREEAQEAADEEDDDFVPPDSGHEIDEDEMYDDDVEMTDADDGANSDSSSDPSSSDSTIDDEDEDDSTDSIPRIRCWDIEREILQSLARHWESVVDLTSDD